MCVCVCVYVCVPSEALAQLMDAGRRVIDSPVHLADFGKLAASQGSEL